MVSWKRNLYIMWAVQFIAMCSLTLASPFLPLFIEEELGIHSTEAVEMWTGIIAAANFVTAAVMAPIWGRTADRYGRKVMVIRALGSLSLFMYLSSYVGSIYQFLGVRLLMGSFSGFSAAAIALVGSSTPDVYLGQALGTLQSAQMAGVVLGPMIGGALASVAGYRPVFKLTGITLLALLFVTAVFVKEDFEPGDNIAGGNGSGLRDLLSEGRFMAVFGALIAAQLAVRSVGPIIPIYVDMLGAVGAGVAFVSGVVYGVTGLGNILSAPFMGRKGDRSGYWAVLLKGLILAAASFVPQVFATSAWQLLFPRFLFGVALGAIVPSAHAAVGSMVSKDKSGSTYGIIAAATFTGGFIGPLLGGAISALIGIRWVFATDALLLAGVAFWMWVTMRSAKSGSVSRTKAL